MKYSVYLTSGQIIKTGDCPEEMIDIQGEFVLPVKSDLNLQYVFNKNVIDMPEKPNAFCIFDYDTKQWIDPRTNETQWPIVKSQRDALLAASDWTQLTDVVLSNKDQWKVYRQELRDITTQPDPFNIIWPTPPQG